MITNRFYRATFIRITVVIPGYIMLVLIDKSFLMMTVIKMMFFDNYVNRNVSTPL